MAEWETSLATKLDDQSSTPRTYMERTRCPLTFIGMPHHTHTLNKCYKKYYKLDMMANTFSLRTLGMKAGKSMI